jgi:magnesium chelatase subunit D
MTAQAPVAAEAPADAGTDAALVAALFAVDPVGLGGVALRARAGAARERWLALLKQLLPADRPLRRVPLNIGDTALLGGLDLGATLQAGRPVAQQGLLAQADGGVVVLAMAERISPATAARLASVLDQGEVVLERDGLALRRPARLGMVALDEGDTDDEQLPAALHDRVAFHLWLAPESAPLKSGADWQRSDILAAQARLPRVGVDDGVLQSLCGAAIALGVTSLRAPLLALRVARAAAALAGDSRAGEDHAVLAARLVLAPRATRLPAPPEPQPATDQPPTDATPPAPQDAADHTDPATDPPPPEPTPEPSPESEPSAEALAELVLAAAQAAIPPGLLAMLQIGRAARGQSQTGGRAGAVLKNQSRGRPIGARRGEPRQGARLNVIETLRAAAPWQTLRARQAQLPAGGPAASPGPRRIHVRREDFHVTRFKQQGQTTTVFVVDASGSSALHRLAEAKGAVELLLADCYVRRDQVAVIAFRGKLTELLLPPTRSLARAKRSLAALPGGGGTPLAAGLDAALLLALQIQRRGETPVMVLLTDGRANIARDGSPGRAQANQDALAAARQIRAAGLTALLLDTSPQAQPTAQALAQAMGATYLPLPYAGAQVLSRAVRAATPHSPVGA